MTSSITNRSQDSNFTGNLLERAFILARSGDHDNLVDMARQLKNEGFTQVAAHLDSPSLRRQLKALMLKARLAEPKLAERPVAKAY